MESIVFVGIQATGKSSFFRERFSRTHVRLEASTPKTPELLNECVERRRPFVVDHTNHTVEARAPFIKLARQRGFRVVGYYFETKVLEALRRNEARPPPERVPERGLLITRNKMQRPSLDEGFDELFQVELADEAGFAVKAWRELRTLS